MGLTRIRWASSAAFALGACLVTASGCQPSAEPSAPTFASGNPTPAISSATSASPDPDASVPSTDRVRPSEEAWGSIGTIRLPIAVESKRYFVFSGGGTPDGAFLIGNVIRNDFLNSTSPTPGDVVLYELATGKIRKLATMHGPDSQVTSAAADDQWIVWMESDDPDAYNWHLFAANRATGGVLEVATAATIDGHPVPSPLTFVWVSHGTVVWGQGLGTGIAEGSVENAVVQRHDLSTGVTETIARRAGNPTLSWPWIAWEEFPASSSARTVFSNLETGWSEALDTLPASIVLSRQSAAYASKDLHSIWVIDDVTQPASAVEIATALNNADYLQWPSINERIVGWVQDDRSVVYDRTERRLVGLPIANGWSWGTTAGPNLVWFETDPGHAATEHPDWMVVADTRTFPVLP